MLRGVVLLAAASILAGCSASAGDTGAGDTGAGDTGAGDSAGIVWAEPVVVAEGGGHRGPWRMNRSDYDYVDDPAVAIDEAGTVAIAWADQAAMDIRLQVFEPDGETRFAEPVDVSRSPETFSWLPRLRFIDGSDDGIAVLWQEIVFTGGSHGGEAHFARSTDGGASFEPVINLSKSQAGDGKGRLTAERWHNGSLDIARGPDGHLFVAWTEYEGRLWFARSTDGGASFAEPRHIAGDMAEPARGPALAADDAGQVHLAWTVGEDPAADIHITRSSDAGKTFAEPAPAHERPGHADAPRLALDEDGSLHLVYAESAEGPFQRYHILHARGEPGATTLGQPRTISAALPEGIESAAFPELTLAGPGRLLALWELFPDSRYRPQGLGYAASADGGQSFSDPKLVPGSIDQAHGVNGGQQGLFMRRLAANTNGDLALAHTTFNPGQASLIRLYRGRWPKD